MDDKERTFDEDVKINRFRLEQECEEQPSKYLFWANLLADAKAEVDRLENQLRLTLAEQEKKTRFSMEEAGVKATEASVKAGVETSDAVFSAREKLQEAESVQYHLEAGVKAFEHRKSEIDNLTQLWIKGYYAKPDGGRRSVTDDVSSDIRKDLNKDKKRKGEE
jgi:hypothetical protein